MGNLFCKNKDLLNATNDIPLYSLDGKKFICKVVSIYDGDTCTVVFKNNKELQKYKVRMTGYDSPEIKPRKNVENREKIIKEAKKAKNALQTIINDKLVLIKCGKWDKYGRLLGTLFTIKNNININEWMINNNYGYAYDGGTKKIINYN